MTRCELQHKIQQRQQPKPRGDFVPSPTDTRYKKDENGKYVKFDKAELLQSTGISKDDKLYLVADIARTGKQSYSFGTEMRTADEVFSREHLQSLQNLPITIGHKELEPKQSDIVGRLRDAKQVGNYVQGLLVIEDPTTIRQIQKGLLSGFSLGYTSNDIIKDGQTYQTNLKPFHLALLPTPTHSRCGTTCKILDLKEVA